MIDFDKDIPEEDKVCVYCEYFGTGMYRTDDETKCCGTMPCSNYHADNTENYFVPEDWYLKDRFGCSACEYYYGGKPTEECGSCKRYYEDKWVRQREVE